MCSLHIAVPFVLNTVLVAVYSGVCSELLLKVLVSNYQPELIRGFMVTGQHFREHSCSRLNHAPQKTPTLPDGIVQLSDCFTSGKHVISSATIHNTVGQCKGLSFHDNPNASRTFLPPGALGNRQQLTRDCLTKTLRPHSPRLHHLHGPVLQGVCTVIITLECII